MYKLTNNIKIHFVGLDIQNFRWPIGKARNKLSRVRTRLNSFSARFGLGLAEV